MGFAQGDDFVTVYPKRKLWEAQGPRAVTLGDVMFPSKP
jgi:hypothetical protein